MGRHDKQHNDIQHNDTQHNDTQNNGLGLISDAQHKGDIEQRNLA